MVRNKVTIILICLTVVQLICLIALNSLSSENLRLKRTIQNMALRSSNVQNVSTPKAAFKAMATSLAGLSEPSNTNKIPRRLLPSEITILLLKSLEDSRFEKKLVNMKSAYPAAHIMTINGTESYGESLNRMITDVKTEYFMVLEADVAISDRANEGIGVLWDALEKYPEIDFVGGSYLSGDKFYITCHRFKFCRYTFSESYEYERSLENLMICDGTSTSFMGRTKSMNKIKGGFDKKISDILVVKEFFVRAKSVGNVVVATTPSFILMIDQYKSLYDKWLSREVAKELVSFAVKHKVFIFKDEEGSVIDLCSPTSSLSGKDLCIEENSHRFMIGGGHWAEDGLYTYPYLLWYLKQTLREVTDFFEKHNVNYVVKGGVSLGAVKMHSILPWDAGDVDILIYSLNAPQLLAILAPWGAKMGYIVREHPESKAIHVFCTPKEIGDVSGGLATLHPMPGPPPKYMRIKTNGIWVRYARDLFSVIIKYYGNRYLEHKIYQSTEAIRCKKKGHNACLPNFNTIYEGKGGTYREYFCDG